MAGYQGKKLRQPFTYLYFSTLSQGSPKWQSLNTLVLSFGNKKLRLTPAILNMDETQNGDTRLYVERMRVRVPYKDFLSLGRAGKFYVTVGGATLEVSKRSATGISTLARRLQ